MAIGQGYRARAGLAKEGDQSVWSSTTVSASVGAGDLIPLLSEGIEQHINRLPIDVLQGNAGRSDSVITGKRYTGPITFRGQYSGMEGLLAEAFGFEEPAPAPSTGPTGVRYRLYELASDLNRRSWQMGEGFKFGSGLLFGDKRVAAGTLVIDKQVSQWEFESAMVDSLEMTATPANGLVLTANIIARDLDRASTVNTGSTGFTFPGGTNRILFHDLQFRIGNYSTATGLSTGNIAKITEFRINLNNNLDTDLQTSGTSQEIVEPIRTGTRSVTGSFTIPRYSTGDEASFDTYNADTVLAAQFKFKGPTLGSTNYLFEIYLPSIKYTKATANVAGPQTLSITYEWEAFVPAGKEYGFPTDRKGGEMFLKLQNNVSVNYLCTG